jgi:hypothetical protein
MSIITFTTKTVSGAMSKTQSQAKIRVSRTEESDVVMEGYIGGPRVKGDDGKYRASEYGRLPFQAAIAGTGPAQRYVLEIAGGLRGVLFPTTNKTGDNSPDYSGNIDLGNDTELPLFGRKVNSDNGSFISLSSGEAQPIKPKNGKHSEPDQQAPSFDGDDDIPF